MLREILCKDLVTVEPDASVAEAARRMARHHVGAILVLDNGRPRGILTDRDIVVSCVAENVDVNDCTVEQVMSESLETARDTDGFYECIRRMSLAGVHRIPVVDERSQVVGIVSFDDLLRVISKELFELAGGKDAAPGVVARQSAA